jgi:RNA polymerase sigma factor (sigma-70 family)
MLLPELIDQLPHRERVVVNGLFYERASYRELAKRLGCDSKNVQVIRDRAVEMLRAGILELQEFQG